MNQERIIVTGAGGFLGSYLSRYFVLQGAHVVPFGRSLDRNVILNQTVWKRKMEEPLPSSAFEQLLQAMEPSIVIHAAGTSSVPKSIEGPYEDFKNSVDVFAYVLDSVKRYSPKTKVVLLSSAAVYGSPESLPISETMDRKPISPYGYHKFMNELLAEEYEQVYGISALILRVFSAYGEGLKRQVMFDLCTKFLTENTEFVAVYGTGQETRDFINVEDLVHAVDNLIRKNATGVFNVASGRSTSISELAFLIRDSLAVNKEIVFTGSSREGDPTCWKASIDKLSSFGFSPAVSIEEGVNKYCRWLKANAGG